jgi:hypothetical protein
MFDRTSPCRICGIRHAHHLIGNAVGFLFVSVIRLADSKFALNEMAQSTIAQRASQLMDRMDFGAF